ncbi:MAG: molybdate ABC transporter substrate-binding protein [Verrucomicrobia bacterium]|nr:molybdate ABC transporter substrate-binding protein [Verrucomicrobiota bacterium]
MARGKLILILIGAAIVGLGAILASPESDRGSESGDPLILHCAAGLRLPVTEIVDAYKKQTGRSVQLNFGPSGALEATLEVAGGDLFLPADRSYIDSTTSKGLVDEVIPVAYLTAGIAVVRGNPLKIDGLDALASEGVKVVLANPEAAIGKFTRKVLTTAGLADQIERNVIVTKPTVNEVAETVELGLADAGIIWDALAGQYTNVAFVHVPEFDQHRQQACVGVLRSARSPTRALHFAHYLAAHDRGQEIFRKHGYEIPEGESGRMSE